MIAEGWPSLTSLCFPGACIVCVSLAYATTTDITSWPIPPHTTVEPYRDSFWENQLPKCIMLLSGSTEFVEKVCATRPFDGYFVCSLDMDSRPLDALQREGFWFQLRHADFDGVTSGIWWFGSNIFTLSAPFPLPSKLRLGHVLGDTKSGPSLPPPSNPLKIFSTISFEGGSKVLNPGSLLPIKAPGTKVLCYSVFSPTRWVTRALTSHELERCYDMHDHQLQYWKDVPISSIPTTGLPFHGSVPLRLTHALGDLIFAQSFYGDSQRNHEVAPMEATPR